MARLKTRGAHGEPERLCWDVGFLWAMKKNRWRVTKEATGRPRASKLIVQEFSREGIPIERRIRRRRVQRRRSLRKNTQEKD